MLLEKLISGVKETERLYEFANLSGSSVIKLVLSKQKLPYYEIVNFEVPIGTGNVDANSVVDGVQVNFDNGSLIFYPDSSGILWGYLIDTEYNRKQLASCVHKNWFRILDSNVRAEINQLALLNGETLTVDKPKYEKMSVREQEAIDKMKKMEEELMATRRDMAKMMEMLNGKKEQENNTQEEISFTPPPVDEGVSGRRRSSVK
jgi:phage pi2 protein 07